MPPTEPMSGEWIAKWGRWKAGGLKELWHLGGIFPHIGFDASVRSLYQNLQIYLPFLLQLHIPQVKWLPIQQYDNNGDNRRLCACSYLANFTIRVSFPVYLMRNGMQAILVYAVGTLLFPNPHDNSRSHSICPTFRLTALETFLCFGKGLLLFFLTV